MKITLITVCRNSASVIRTALESVLAQRGAGVEYLVIDGASTDGTVEILREYEAKFRALSSAEGTSSAVTFRFVSERDAGMYDAMNKGLAMATGEVIGILNADDVLASDTTLARIAEAFDADASLDGTYADIRFVRDGAGEVGSDARAAMEALRALVQSLAVPFRRPDRASLDLLPRVLLRPLGRLFARLRYVRRLRLAPAVHLEEPRADALSPVLHDCDARRRSVHERLADHSEDQCD